MASGHTTNGRGVGGQRLNCFWIITRRQRQKRIQTAITRQRLRYHTYTKNRLL
jgi:hypothetical protein